MGLVRRYRLTPVDVLAAVKTLDGAGSGLDSDLIDGKHAAELVTDSVQQAANNAALNFYSKNQVDTKDTEAISAAVDRAGTAAGLRHYTKSEIDTMIGNIETTIRNMQLMIGNLNTLLAAI